MYTVKETPTRQTARVQKAWYRLGRLTETYGIYGHETCVSYVSYVSMVSRTIPYSAYHTRVIRSDENTPVKWPQSLAATAVFHPHIRECRASRKLKVPAIVPSPLG